METPMQRGGEGVWVPGSSSALLDTDPAPEGWGETLAWSIIQCFVWGAGEISKLLCFAQEVPGDLWVVLNKGFCGW